MSQLSVNEAWAQSPLAHADLKTLARKGDCQGAVCVQELKLLGHLVLRGSTENAVFMAGVEKVINMTLPGILQSVETGGVSVNGISPDEWLLIGAAEKIAQLESELRATLTGHYSLVDVSGGQTVLALGGAAAREVLQKSTSYDVHDRNFPVGKVVTTVFAKAQAIIRRTGEDSWELVVRRSFADYIWLWLQNACAEYGLVVKD